MRGCICFILIVKKNKIQFVKYHTLLLNTSFTKLQLPIPCRKQRIFNTRFGLPSQLSIGKFRIGPNFFNITSTTTNYLIVQLYTCCLFKSMDKFQNRKSTSSTNIEYFHFFFLFLLQDSLYCHYMSLCQVYNVNEVTNAGAIRRIIIITEYAQLLTNADSSLSKIWYQILWYPIRQFTQQSSRMSTNRIEIAQQDCTYRSTRSYRITHNLFIDLLCISIGRLSLLDRCIFCNRQFIRLTIYST